METSAAKQRITVSASIDAPVQQVWKCWTDPQHITQWNFATDEWHSPKAENDLRVGGKFVSRMEARDGSMGFDFEGVYTNVAPEQHLAYTMPDGRKVRIDFKEQEGKTLVTETFDAETSHSLEMQQGGWQAILNNFKKYVETLGGLKKLQYQLVIDAPVAKVYKTMLEKNTYEQWTAAFHPGSHYQGSWETGSKILFLGPDQNGKMGGMVSRIKENIPQQVVSIEHLGLYHDGQEITTGKEVESWAGALENYYFEAVGDSTRLKVELDVNPEFEQHFADTWPKALQKLKDICEA